MSTITGKVDAAYESTHERLKEDPEYVRLKAAAEAEAAAASSSWLERNRFALYIEANTPGIGRPAPLNITDFLLSRIAEDEAAARAALPDRWGSIHSDGRDWSHDIQASDRDATEAQDEHARVWWPGRVLAECAAKRAVVEKHQQWPVLVECEPSEIERVEAGLNDFTYRVTREIAWMTTREYIKRFGTEPPTAPMVAALATVYATHPDYRQEWTKA